jgi:acetylglutamate/LysW-gamma-L-alpha-aminoadipate kinase
LNHREHRVTTQAKIENILVVKIGGGAGLDMARCAADLAALAKARPVVVVHGVSDMMNRLCEERGIPVRTITSPNGHSSRYTDAATRDVFVEAAGRVNEELSGLLRELEIPTPNPSPLRKEGDTNYLPNVYVRAERKDAIRAVVDGRIRMIRDDYSGTITGADAAGLLELLQQGITPVVPPLATSTDGLLNVDGDRAAAAIAGALGAADLVILSNVRGLYKQFPDEGSFVTQVNRAQLDQALEWAQGRMKRKVLGAQEALKGGVARVIIGDGRVDNPVSQALGGAGTTFS